MYKKRWYDGLHDIYEDKNEFEIKFGCFGGDGGNGNGSKSPAPPSDPTPDTGFRGEQTAAAKAAAEAAKAAAEAEVEANLAGKAKAAQDLQGKVAEAVAASTGTVGPANVGGPRGLSIGTPAEQLAETRTPQEIADSVSLAGLSTGPVSAPTTSVNDLTVGVGLPGTTVAPAVKGFQDYVNELTATSPQAKAADDYAKTYGNTGMYSETLGDGQGNIGGSYSNQTTQSGLSIDALGGTISLGKPDNFSLENLGAKATYSRPMAKGGVVQQGIGSIFPYPRRR